MYYHKSFIKISQLLIILFSIIHSTSLFAMPKAINMPGNLNNIDHKNLKLITYYIRAYSKGNQLSKIIKKSKYLVQHILKELKKRNLPTELALLPIIESTYRPFAISNKGAYGIWQISYITGKRYGLIYANHDFRTDLTASTDAALTYLEFLYKKFNNDWLLALAAYNAGEGRISGAIKKNKLLSKNANYWELGLPEQTKHYVPKLLALSIIFNNPECFGLEF
jgi:membrane-bound lytic murein transglycosylase D